MAMLVITGRKALGKWTLQFVLHNATVKEIMWASWGYERPADVIINGSPSPWARSAPDQTRLVLIGVGAPDFPQDCEFKSERCAFRSLSETWAVGHHHAWRHGGY
jgi:hypothetical protein